MGSGVLGYYQIVGLYSLLVTYTAAHAHVQAYTGYAEAGRADGE